jgi:hypothetical protein
LARPAFLFLPSPIPAPQYVTLEVCAWPALARLPGVKPATEAPNPRSTTFSLLLLGIALGLWVGEVAGPLPALLAVALCLILAMLAGLSYKRQRENRYALTDAFLTLEGYQPPKTTR